MPEELTATVAGAELHTPGDVVGPMYADGGMVAWAWLDSGVANFLTTIHPDDTMGTCLRRAAGCTRGPRAAPMCAVDYNLYMIAVDIVGCAAAAHFLHRRCFCHRHFFMLS